MTREEIEEIRNKGVLALPEEGSIVKLVQKLLAHIDTIEADKKELIEMVRVFAGTPEEISNYEDSSWEVKVDYQREAYELIERVGE